MFFSRQCCQRMGDRVTENDSLKCIVFLACYLFVQSLSSLRFINSETFLWFFFFFEGKDFFLCGHWSNYSVFFFIDLKVFVNLTYLYLSEIKKQGLIFSVGMGHLIICRKNFDLDRGFLSKLVFLLYACRASV